MQKKFHVKYLGGFNYPSYIETIVLEDTESAICGYISWALLHSAANSVMLIQPYNDGGRVVAMGTKRVQITLKRDGAADITKLI